MADCRPLLATLILCAGLLGCGQKGPLYLPDAPERPPQPERDPTIERALPQDDERDAGAQTELDADPAEGRAQ
ncbi:MAG: lipoprotein [Pseudomonadales bacterium]